MSKKIRIGSRESRLAVIQSEIIACKIAENFPQYETEIITMKTTGDKILDRTLDKIGGKGLFVKELDRALLENEVDITVHSLKDVPADIDERLPLVAFTERRYPYDVLVLPKGEKDVDFSKPIGSSSSRRSIQFRKMYPNANIQPIRGNVVTRLKKLDEGLFGALILAQAGLERLGLTNRISRVFTEDELIPAAGQGIIAVQARKGEYYDFISGISCKQSEICASAERAFVRELNGGCSSPVAAYARLDGNIIVLKCFYADEKTDFIREVCGNAGDAQRLGKELAQSIREELK